MLNKAIQTKLELLYKLILFTKMIDITHTCVMRLTNYASLEFTTVVVDSTFLNKMEPVVLCLLSVACNSAF
jgi:hypothetical protein